VAFVSLANQAIFPWSPGLHPEDDLSAHRRVSDMDVTSIHSSPHSLSGKRLVLLIYYGRM